MTVEVRPVTSRRERRLFWSVPARLHGRDPCFVPMLDAALAAVLDRKKNPFWRRAEGCEWLAWRDGRPVGRVGACRDGALDERVPGCGAVGFLDCAEDRELAGTLLETAEAWLRERGCTRGRGPLNYSIHDTAGVLVDGFLTPPTIDTTWNPPYYDTLWQAHGWHGAQDMLGLDGTHEVGGPDRALRFAERARRKGIVGRALDLRNFDEEVARVHKIYNAAWDDNWGHVPITAEEFAFKAKDLKAILDPALLRIAEVDGEPVGFFLGLPDLNPAIRRSGGRLFPLGWWRVLRAGRKSRRVRVVGLGVVPGYRKRGVEILLLGETYVRMRDRYTWHEASWVLADNKALLNGLALHNLHPYKRWRLYEKEF